LSLYLAVDIFTKGKLLSNNLVTIALNALHAQSICILLIEDQSILARSLAKLLFIGFREYPVSK